ncbi:S-type pyocin domain-containing protein [Pseudomonas sp. SK3(2021)]|uniref:S-type pyocin domain-containing protein n=1 Tax=Pseudomonas sp. SK3(2021) TaxID=2841064 RepID=UPI002078A7F4|nr:S-type pyocin domain-containing protein [Pseudomonas sp. SK3(2021)]
MPTRYPQPCQPAPLNKPLKGPVYRGEEPAPPEPIPEPTKIFSEPEPMRPGYVFAKCSKLPNSVANYSNGRGPFPIDTAKDYGNLVLLGARESDETGKHPLKKISGTLPAGLGALALQGLASAAGASCGGLCGPAATGSTAIAGSVATGALSGVVALLWPSSLGDGALYTEEQLRTLDQGRTRLRLRVEELPDGTLKGYGYNTQLRSDWEMIPVVQFNQVKGEMVADLDDGIRLIWTPAVDPASTLGIPALETAPQAPHIWIFPPTELADNIIVNPIYPPEYQDFILVFPIGSGVLPLYIVMNVRHDPGIVTGVGEDVFGIWLAGAGEGLGAPIPARIADQLRGKSYNSFDAFREAVWTVVANDGELASQFNSRNLTDMANGLAPISRKGDQVGKRKKYEMHHVEHIKDGGAVYDLDNLRVVTVRRHIDIHKEGN